MSLPLKADIFEHWKDWLDKNGFDWGEPSCWACENGWEGRHDVNNPTASWDRIRAAWNKVPLQRCHIIPRQLGGSDDLSNLFLMCRECHDLAPNTTSREAFMIWVKKQNHSRRVTAKIKEELQTYGFHQAEFAHLMETMRSPEFEEWMDENTGIHFNQRGYGAKLTISTFIAALYEYKKNGFGMGG